MLLVLAIGATVWVCVAVQVVALCVFAKRGDAAMIGEQAHAAVPVRSRAGSPVSQLPAGPPARSAPPSWTVV